MTPLHHAATADEFGIALTLTPAPDPLAELRAALADAAGAVLAARKEEDDRLIAGMDRLMSGLELSDDGGPWAPAFMWSSAAGYMAAVLADVVRRVRGG